VLEDGNDVCNSESDSDNDDHGTEILDGYKDIPVDSHGDPQGAGHRVSTEQANAMRAAAKQVSPQASRMDSPPVYERKATPLNSDDEAPPLSYDEEKAVGHEKRMARARLEKSSQANESIHTMTTRSKEKEQQSSAKFVPLKKKASRAGGLRSEVSSG
jgi:hypothetical protein